MTLWENIFFVSDKGVFAIKEGKVEVILEYKHPCYGLTWNKEHLFLTTYTGLEKLDKCFNLICVSTLSRVDFHQCLYSAEGKLYVCAPKLKGAIDVSFNNSLAINKVVFFEGSNRHFNSLFYFEDHYYACLHSHCEPSVCSAQPERHSTVVKLNKNFEVVQKWDGVGCGNHNVYVDGENLYTLNSTFGSISVVNIATGKKKEAVVKIDGQQILYLRGLAKNKDCFYIGATEHAERSMRQFVKSYIVALDNNLRIIDKFLIPGKHHIRDIRLYNQQDLAHNHIVLER